MINIHIRYVLVLIFTLILQLTFVDYIQIFNWHPDLLLVVLVAYGLQKGPNVGMTAGFFTGLVQDVLSTHFFGLAALSKTIAGFIAGSLANKFSPRTEYILTLILCALAHDIAYFFIYTLGENFSLQSLVVLYTIPNVLYTTVVGGVLHYLFRGAMSED